MTRPAVLVITATDSSGGAGLTRDVRVLSDFSVDALCVVTAVTAQSDKKVTAVHHVPPEVIRAQIVAALATRQVGAIKIGMLGTRATVEAVLEGLTASQSVRGWSLTAGSVPDESVVGGSVVGGSVVGGSVVGGSVADGSVADGSVADGSVLGGSVARGLSHEGSSPGAGLSRGPAIVIDPVLVSTSGGVLLDAGGRTALTELLFPLATLVTPNVPEAAALLGEAIAADEGELVQQGLRLLRFGGRAILLKGGHRYAGHGNASGADAGERDVGRRYAGHSDVEDAEEAVDLLISAAADGHTVKRIVSRRVAGTSRGTGCALASAIAAGLAAGKPLDDACRAAKNYVLGMLTRVR